MARLSVAADYAVVLSNSRGPQTLTDLVAELGPLARAAASDQAASEGDLVVVTIPLRTYQSVPAAPLAESWRQQPGTPVYVIPYGQRSDRSCTPADEAVVRAALAHASR